MILLPAKSFRRKQNYVNSLSWKQFSRTEVLEGSKRSRTVSSEAKYDGQSRQEAKNGGLVYTLCLFSLFGHDLLFCQYEMFFSSYLYFVYNSLL